VPYDVVPNHPSCPTSKSWAVTSPGRETPHGCFASKAAATKQQAALYASKVSEALEDLSDDARKSIMGMLPEEGEWPYEPDLAAVEQVYQRGVREYPGNIDLSAHQWALSRVAAFLHIHEYGKPDNPDYEEDNDLLPPQHPLAEADKSTPAPPGDRITGSRRNRAGSASAGEGVTFSASVTKALETKVASHNENATHKTNLRTLKAVYRRGAGAFSVSHRPGMTRNQWAMGRVNAFLKLLRSGRPDDADYTTDNDLLPSSHPRASTGEARRYDMDDAILLEALSQTERRRYATIVRRLPDGRTEYKFPIPDKAHARAALAYLHRSDLTPTEKAKVVRKAYRVLGIKRDAVRPAMAEAMAGVMKTDMGMQFPASAYAYVPDPARPSTWKVRLWENPDAKVTKASAARAAQALSTAGFRGNQVQLPRDQWAGVRRKVAAAWRSVHSEEEMGAMPRHLREANEQLEIGLTDHSVDIVPGMESDVLDAQTNEPEIAEAEIAEAASGAGATLDKNEVVVTVLQPGFNRSGARYYPVDAIRHAVSEGLFDNRKMFVNHPSASELRERPERNLTDWVSTVKETWIDEETGSIKARIKVVQNWFGDFLKQLQENDALADVGLSIFAQGQVQRKKIDGRLTDVVERFTRALSVDWVTEPGAGGRVDAIWEAYQPVRAKEQETNVLNTMSAAEAVATLREQRPDVIEVLESEHRAEETVRETEAVLAEAQERISALENEIEAKDSELSELRQAAIVAERDEIVREALAKSELPAPAQERVVKAVGEPVLTEDGALDVEATQTEISALVEAEKAYAEELIKESRPAGGRGVTGLGDRAEEQHTPQVQDKVAADVARRMGLATEELEA